jgi:uncharacterized protein YfdQ (DUF2303 family)
VHDAASFIAYIGQARDSRSPRCGRTSPRPGSPRPQLPHRRSVADNEAGWEDHKVVYGVQHTDAWKAWTAHDGKLLSQTAFAEHIEDRTIDIVEPTAADMLELAQSFQATIGVRFESSKVLASGERQLEYKETVDARAGRTGHLEIPREFRLGLVPFEGAARYPVIARFRYRLQDGNLLIGYRLERPATSCVAAFDEVVGQVRDGVAAPVYNGSAK